MKAKENDKTNTWDPEAVPTRIRGFDPPELDSMTDEMRIQYLLDKESFFVEHLQVRQFFRRFDTIRAQGRILRTTSLAMIGGSGSGKSTMAEAYAHCNGNDPKFHAEFVEWPIVIVRMPAASRPAALFERVLIVLNENQVDKGTTSQKMDRVVGTLNKSKTQLVFIDEVHNVMGCGGDRTQDFMLTVLKDLANECKIPFVLMGTEELEKLLARNEEVSRRFPVVELKAFKGITKDFREFLAGFESMLPLRKSSDLASNNDAMTEILKFSEGLVADISAVIRAAAVAAIESGTEKITLKEIKKGEELIKDRVVLE